MSDLKLINSYETFDYSVGTIKESREQNDGKIIMKGILQKADVLNQNGRIYPMHVLEREVRNYQKFINENRALGECVPPGTEIYTRAGWKNIENIAEDEFIFTLNVGTNQTQLQRITKKVVLPFDGDLLRFRNAQSIDMCLTPSHKMLLWDRKGVSYTITAQEFHDGWKARDSRLSHSSVRNTGDCGTIDVWDRSDDRPSPDEGRMILGKNVCLDFRFLNVEQVSYKGDVFCVTVPNGTWLMRYNGKVCWTHNCDHPESSVVNLKNVSHIVRSAYIEQGTVMGTVELLDTPSGKILQSLVESGVKLGISSRGVGSTKKQGDYHVVQDDFQLICWDYVSEPSTSGAFMMQEGKTVSHDELRHIFNKSDKINRILNDILFYNNVNRIA